MVAVSSKSGRQWSQPHVEMTNPPSSVAISFCVETLSYAAVGPISLVRLR
jgi:hypothetical protein